MTAATHAQTVREALKNTHTYREGHGRNAEMCAHQSCSNVFAALDALVALAERADDTSVAHWRNEVRRCQSERDAAEALAEQLRGALDDAHTAAMDFQTHAEQLQRERDEARAYAESQDWHTEWYAPMKARAEAAEQERDEAREDYEKQREYADEQYRKALAAEAQAEQARAALRQIANLGSPRTALENRDLARAVLADVSAPAGGAKETA